MYKVEKVQDSTRAIGVVTFDGDIGYPYFANYRSDIVSALLKAKCNYGAVLDLTQAFGIDQFFWLFIDHLEMNGFGWIAVGADIDQPNNQATTIDEAAMRLYSGEGRRW